MASLRNVVYEDTSVSSGTLEEWVKAVLHVQKAWHPAPRFWNIRNVLRNTDGVIRIAEQSMGPCGQRAGPANSMPALPQK
jgi:hypothetical protein